LGREIQGGGQIRGFHGSASAIEQRPVSALIPYAENARTHSPAQVAQIVASVSEFDVTAPILIDSGGNHRRSGPIMAAKEMGLETVPCIVLGHLTPALLGKAIGNHRVRSWGRECADDDLEGALEKSGFGGKQSVCAPGIGPEHLTDRMCRRTQTLLGRSSIATSLL
jgi:hypothetical protein